MSKLLTIIEEITADAEIRRLSSPGESGKKYFFSQEIWSNLQGEKCSINWQKCLKVDYDSKFLVWKEWYTYCKKKFQDNFSAGETTRKRG